MENEIDLKVFDGITFDPHKKALRAKRVIKRIKENRPAHQGQERQKRIFPDRVLTKENQKHLLGYAQHLINQMKKEEGSFASLEKNLSEAWCFCLYLNKTNSKETTEKDIKVWWNSQLDRLSNKKISPETVKKYYTCIVKFYQFLEGLAPKKIPKRFQDLEQPRARKPGLEIIPPSQADIKKFLECVYVEGKRFSIRNKAIFALANDTGARISEILSIKNKHIKPEENYLIVSFPISKTTPRTVISFLAKKDLEAWAKVSPNKDKGQDSFFFCQADGSACTYHSLIESFKKALKKSGINWKEGKSLHYFRSLCSSRFYNWPYSLKHAWFGWAFKDHEAAYTKINYKQFVKTYFATLKEEKNPLMGNDLPFWANEDLTEKVMQELANKPEFQMLLKQMIREKGGA